MVSAIYDFESSLLLVTGAMIKLLYKIRLLVGTRHINLKGLALIPINYVTLLGKNPLCDLACKGQACKEKKVNYRH